MKTEITKRDEKFYSSVGTWKEAFKVSLGNVKAYRERLAELTSWDKNGSERERMVKITALQILIHQSK